MNGQINTLGDIVRITRKSRHLSQEELARRVGVCKRTIIDIENNTSNPKFEILYSLIRELNLPLNQIFYPENSENFESKNILLEEIHNCSEHDLKIILPVVKSLKETLEKQREEK